MTDGTSLGTTSTIQNWWGEAGNAGYSGRQMITSLGRDTTQVITSAGAGDRNLIGSTSPSPSQTATNSGKDEFGSTTTISSSSSALRASGGSGTIPAAPFTWRWVENSNGYSTSNTLSSLNPTANMSFDRNYMYRTIGSDGSGNNTRVLDVMENQAASTNVYNGNGMAWRLYTYNPTISNSANFPAGGSTNPFGRVASTGVTTIFAESTPLIYSHAGTGDFSNSTGLTNKRGAVDEMADSDLYLQVFDPDYSGDELAMPASNQTMCTSAKSEVTTAGEFNGTGNYTGTNANACSTEWFGSSISWARDAMWRGVLRNLTRRISIRV